MLRQSFRGFPSALRLCLAEWNLRRRAHIVSGARSRPRRGTPLRERRVKNRASFASLRAFARVCDRATERAQRRGILFQEMAVFARRTVTDGRRRFVRVPLGVPVEISGESDDF